MKERLITIFIFIAIIISSFYFGFERLKNFSGVDEPYWSYDRVPQFWNAIAKGKWKSTYLCDKPGVMTAAISGLGLPFISENIKDLHKLRYQPKTPEQVAAIRDIYYKLRIPIFIFNLLALPAFYFLLKKLFNQNTARFSVIFMGLSPVLLGISLIINTDSVLWILTGLSTISLFTFLKTNQRKFLFLSGFLLGLSVISKFPSLVLFVYFFLIFILDYIFDAHNKMNIREYLKKASFNYFLLFITAMITGFIFFPATWVKLSLLLKYTVNHPVFSSTRPLFAAVILLGALDYFIFKSKFSAVIFGFFVKYRHAIVKLTVGLFFLLAIFVFLHVWGVVHVYNLNDLIASPKGSENSQLTFNYILSYILADLYSLLFSISPLVLISIVTALIYILKQKELDRDSITVLYMLMFIFIVYLGSTVNHVITTVRYQIMVYPLAFILASMGISRIIEEDKVKKYLAAPAAYFVTIILLITSLHFIKPDYLAYASEILPENQIVNLKGMGEGSIEAAYYLNSLPNAHEMTIWSDKGAVCEAFVGKCFIDFKRKTFADNKIDYFVVSTDRQSRTVKLSQGLKVVDEENIRAKEDLSSYVRFEDLYNQKNPAFEVIIGGRSVNFVKVIKTSDISH